MEASESLAPGRMESQPRPHARRAHLPERALGSGWWSPRGRKVQGAGSCEGQKWIVFIARGLEADGEGAIKCLSERVIDGPALAKPSRPGNFLQGRRRWGAQVPESGRHSAPPARGRSRTGAPRTKARPLWLSRQ